MNPHIFLARLYAASLDPATQMHLDAADGTAAFARQFEFIESEIVRTEFAPLKSEEFIHYDTSAPAGTKTVTHRTVTEVGQADFVNHYADNLPNADVFTVENEVKVEDLGVEYFYSVQDVQRSAMDPAFRLDAERKLSAINAVRRLHDKTAAEGSTKYGRTGFLNSAAVPIVTAINGTWATATSQEIVDDVVALWSSVSAATEDVIDPDTLLLDSVSYGLISSKPYGADSNFTVLQWLRENLDGVKKIAKWARLKTAGVGDTRRMVAYKYGKDVAKYVAPELFAEEPPQRKSLKIVTPCHGSTGFCDIRKPLGVAYMDGL